MIAPMAASEVLLEPKVARFWRMLLVVGWLGVVLAAGATGVAAWAFEQQAFLVSGLLFVSFAATLLVHCWAFGYLSLVRRRLAIPGLGGALGGRLVLALVAALAPVVSISVAQRVYGEFLPSGWLLPTLGLCAALEIWALWSTRLVLLDHDRRLGGMPAR